MFCSNAHICPGTIVRFTVARVPRPMNGLNSTGNLCSNNRRASSSAAFAPVARSAAALAAAMSASRLVVFPFPNRPVVVSRVDVTRSSTSSALARARASRRRPPLRLVVVVVVVSPRVLSIAFDAAPRACVARRASSARARARADTPRAHLAPRAGVTDVVIPMRVVVAPSASL
jgi:hypothetical protein